MDVGAERQGSMRGVFRLEMEEYELMTAAGQNSLDHGIRRVNRLTGATLIGGLVLTGGLSAVAADAYSGKAVTTAVTPTSVAPDPPSTPTSGPTSPTSTAAAGTSGSGVASAPASRPVTQPVAKPVNKTVTTPVATAPSHTSPRVTSPPVTSPRVTTPPVTAPPVTSARRTRNTQPPPVSGGS
ncbi:MAG: hypothetical protein ABIQ39_14440 [Ilumatobacteraceae bacterium]